jgi:hypothetical protein
MELVMKIEGVSLKYSIPEGVKPENIRCSEQKGRRE